MYNCEYDMDACRLGLSKELYKETPSPTSVCMRVSLLALVIRSRPKRRCLIEVKFVRPAPTLIT